MRLLIATSNIMESEIDVCFVKTTDIANHSAIPFVLSNDWDMCIIQLDDSMPTGYINQIIKEGTQLKAVVDDVSSITPKQVTLLSEIYRQHGSKFRIKYMRDREAFNELVKECLSL